MAKRFLTPINVLNLSSDPESANDGDVYYNTSSNLLRIYSNSQWSDVSSTVSYNLDGGFPFSVYGGIDPINGGGI